LRKPTAFVAEYFCRDCRTPFLNRFPLDEDGRCALCRLGVNGFDAAYSFGAFETELRELIHLFKYGRVGTLAGPLGRFLALALPRTERFDVVVPMPLHWMRRWTRGFNQSELLAREIATRASVPVRNLARRAKATTPQAGLTNAKRRANVSGAFQVRCPERVAGLKILLVDDVMTTGATASACARVLKRAGAARVILLTVARVDRRMNSDVDRLSAKEPKQDHVGSLDGYARA
jgi:ComF family protein